MLDIEQLHAAASIIRADGVDGIQSATRLVGHDVAMGMLVLHLRQAYNPEGGWPDKGDTAGKVNEMLKREKLI